MTTTSERREIQALLRSYREHRVSRVEVFRRAIALGVAPLVIASILMSYDLIEEESDDHHE